WVKLRSDDGFAFIVPRKATTASGFSEAQSNTCQLSLRAVVTEKVLEYLVFKVQYEKAGPKEEIPDFTERIVPELALEMLMAADYLECEFDCILLIILRWF
ncbi:POZ domain-containing protein, partial [Ramaria rubella]